MAENLKRLREQAGMSQPQLAQAAGVPVATLRCWEQATRVPLLTAAVKLADALGITLDELAGRTAIGDAQAEAEEPKKARKGKREK